MALTTAYALAHIAPPLDSAPGSLPVLMTHDQKQTKRRYIKQYFLGADAGTKSVCIVCIRMGWLSLQ